MLAVYTGFPLILYPAVESLWPPLSARLEKKKKIVRNLAHVGLRTGILAVGGKFLHKRVFVGPEPAPEP